MGSRAGSYWCFGENISWIAQIHLGLSPTQAVLLCLLDLVPILERAQRQQAQARPTTPCDEVLQLVLTHMEAEHRLALRRVYARTLPAFVQR